MVYLTPIFTINSIITPHPPTIAEYRNAMKVIRPIVEQHKVTMIPGTITSALSAASGLTINNFTVTFTKLFLVKFAVKLLAKNVVIILNCIVNVYINFISIFSSTFSSISSLTVSPTLSLPPPSTLCQFCYQFRYQLAVTNYRPSKQIHEINQHFYHYLQVHHRLLRQYFRQLFKHFFGTS